MLCSDALKHLNNFLHQSSIMSFWNSFHQPKAQRSGIAAVSIAAAGISMAFVEEDELDGETLTACHFIPCEPEMRADELAFWVKSMDILGCRCRMVLDPADYRIIQSEVPDVAPEEMREALRWRILESLDFSVEEAEIEYFPMPNPQQSGRNDVAAVVACRKSLVQAYSMLCEDAGLKLEKIDIPELSLRNLVALLPENDRGVALLYLNETQGIVQLQKEGTIYITRVIDCGSAMLIPTLSDINANVNGGMAGRLALEIQRSLDYYESFFDMPPIGGLVVAPIAQNTQILVDRLNQELGVIARAMDISALMPCRDRLRLDDAIQQRCLTTIGAALGSSQA